MDATTPTNLNRTEVLSCLDSREIPNHVINNLKALNASESDTTSNQTYPLRSSEMADEDYDETLHPRPLFHTTTTIISDIKLDCLLIPPAWMNGRKIIVIGDVLQLRTKNMLKDSIIVDIVRGSQGTHGALKLEIPPAGFAHSQLHLRANILAPNPAKPNQLSGPRTILDAMVGIDNTLGYLPGSWDHFVVLREGQFIGSLSDIRQAFQWAQNELQYSGQLVFQKVMRRRLTVYQRQNGYGFVCNASLYKKIRRIDFPAQNPDIMIDLGATLNQELINIADPGFQFIMVDNRITNDGYPLPRHATLENVYDKDVDVFNTPFLRGLAGLFGSSSGHAHLGPLGIGKLYEGMWGKGKNALNAPYDLTPRGIQFADDEYKRLQAFHMHKVYTKIRHWPRPRTYSNKWVSHQLRRKNVLVVPDVWDLANWEEDF